MPAFVFDRRGRDEDAPPPRVSETKTEVDVLEVHEEVVVKTADRLESLTANEHARTAQPARVSLPVVRGSLVVTTRPRI